MPADVQCPNVVVIVGPTGSGKTDLALALARKFNGELIAADSRTVYRGMDIGTAKPTEPHHLVDIRDLDQPYSAAEFKADAERLIRGITARRRVPIIVGGTGLYIKALVDNLSLPAIPAQPKIRESLGQQSNRELIALLRRIDPITARAIDRKNKRRLIRALEVCIFTGQPFSALRTKGEPLFEFLQIGVTRTRAALYRRIDARTRAMFRAGLMEEVRHLFARYGPDAEPLRGIIYREVVEYLTHMHDRDHVFGGSFRAGLRALQQRIMFANHRYARHQLMWFKRDERIHWVRTARQAEKLVRLFLSSSRPSGEGA